MKSTPRFNRLDTSLSLPIDLKHFSRLSHFPSSDNLPVGRIFSGTKPIPVGYVIHTHTIRIRLCLNLTNASCRIQNSLMVLGILTSAEVDELQSGAYREGMFYAPVTLFRKVASSIAIPMTTLAPDWSGYISISAQQTELAVWVIRVLIGPVASLFLLCGILFARFCPLTREAHADTRAKITSRKESPAD